MDEHAYLSTNSAKVGRIAKPFLLICVVSNIPVYNNYMVIKHKQIKQSEIIKKCLASTTKKLLQLVGCKTWNSKAWNKFACFGLSYTTHPVKIYKFLYQSGIGSTCTNLWMTSHLQNDKKTNEHHMHLFLLFPNNIPVPQRSCLQKPLDSFYHLVLYIEWTRVVNLTFFPWVLPTNSEKVKWIHFVKYEQIFQEYFRNKLIYNIYKICKDIEFIILPWIEHQRWVYALV